MPPGPVPFASESRHQADPTKSNVGRLGGVSTSSSLTGPKQVLTDKGALEQHYYHNLFSLENRPTVLNGVGHNVIPGSSQVRFNHGLHTSVTTSCADECFAALTSFVGHWDSGFVSRHLLVSGGELWEWMKE
jgi:hypothetical protein